MSKKGLKYTNEMKDLKAMAKILDVKTRGVDQDDLKELILDAIQEKHEAGELNELKELDALVNFYESQIGEGEDEEEKPVKKAKKDKGSKKEEEEEEESDEEESDEEESDEEDEGDTNWWQPDCRT